MTNSANKLFAQLNHFRVNFFGLFGLNDSCIIPVPFARTYARTMSSMAEHANTCQHTCSLVMRTQHPRTRMLSRTHTHTFTKVAAYLQLVIDKYHVCSVHVPPVLLSSMLSNFCFSSAVSTYSEIEHVIKPTGF